jgi:hypothetical protein
MSPFDFREDPKSGLVNFSFLHVLEGARIPQLSCTICYSASELLCVQFPRIQFLWESSEQTTQSICLYYSWVSQFMQPNGS